ncbi:hypothetical protein [Ascidiimonas aurantiaca]|uniref:hypothetical protein n=1 Tax=Ascidiimonas aurantiaca TaxID=1685432 RepID=UPI0030EBFB9F
MKKTLIALLFLITGCNPTEKKVSGLTSYIPQNTFAILQVNDFTSFKSELKNNQFIKPLAESPTGIRFNELLNHLDLLDPETEFILCFNEVGKDNFEYTVITQYNDQLFITDSLQDVRSERFEYDNAFIDRVVTRNNTTYHTKIKDKAVISSSKLVIENLIRQQELNTLSDVKGLKKVFATVNTDISANVFLKGEKFYDFLSSIFPGVQHFEEQIPAEWVAFDPLIDQKQLLLSGIAIPGDSTKTLLSIFKNTNPSENNLPEITPLSARAAISFTYDTWEEVRKNLSAYSDKIKNEKNDFFDFSSEIGLIYHEQGICVGVHFTNIEAAKTSLENQSSLIEEHRNTRIYRMENFSLLADHLFPLVSNVAANFYTTVDHFMVFADQPEKLYPIIDNYQNQSTLKRSSAYKEIQAHLNDKASVLILGVNPGMKEIVSQTVQERYQKDIASLNVKEYPIAALQFISDKNFLHTNAFIKQQDQRPLEGVASQILSIALDNDLATDPVFVQNHRTKEKEIVVQDVRNHLYLISNQGKILWKKELDGKILGRIQQVDLYRNGRLQLAFATDSSIYVIDRNGNTVAPFPIASSKKITQPLAIFDYDKNHNYRFLICQGSSLSMFTKNGEVVKGFGFTKAKSVFTAPPKHLRVSGKDYLIFSEKEQISIRDRKGNHRIKPKSKVTPSGNEIYWYNNQITTTDTEGNLVQIDLKGAIEKKSLGLKENHQIDATAKTLVTFSDNELTIKGKKIELDFGIYTAPRIFYIQNKIYISITDTDANNTYLFDSQGMPIANFPVYGNSSIDLNDIDNDQKIEVVTKGEDNTLLVYRIN